MADEDRLSRMERALSVLVDLAQKADERMTRLEEAQRRSEERWERAEERWARTEESVRALLAIAQIHEREITALTEALKQTRAETDRQTAETNERLNALIDTVERYISERRNGRDVDGQEPTGRES